MIVKEAEYYPRDSKQPFIYLVDHCFSVKGKGTVMTGTVIQGQVKKGELIELPELGFVNKIKSIQMFRKAMDAAQQGDRVGMLVNDLDASQVRIFLYFLILMEFVLWYVVGWLVIRDRCFLSFLTFLLAFVDDFLNRFWNLFYLDFSLRAKNYYKEAFRV